MTFIDNFLAKTKREPKSHRIVTKISNKLAETRELIDQDANNLENQT